MNLYKVSISTASLKAYILSKKEPTKAELQKQFGAMPVEKVELVKEPGFVCFARH